MISGICGMVIKTAFTIMLCVNQVQPAINSGGKGNHNFNIIETAYMPYEKFSCNNVETIYGQSEIQNGDIIIDETYEEEFEKLDSIVEDKNKVTYTEIFEAVKSGNLKELGGLIGQMLYNSLLYELGESKKLFVQLLAVIMLGTVFTNLSGRIGGYAGGNGFFVTYMILAALLLSCFTLASEIAIEVISGINEFMIAFIPAYSMAAAYSNGQETAVFSREIILLVVFICENILLKIVFPIVKCSGVCGLVNKMNTEDYFSKLIDLLKSIAGWIMKTIFAAITGINVIKGIISPSMDKLGRNSAIKIISNMAGGAAVETVASVLVSSGMFIKNCIGIAGAVVIIVIALIPAVKIFLMFMGLKAIAALVQPMGDKRFSEGVASMAEAIELLFKTSGIAVLMFIISITALTMFAR